MKGPNKAVMKKLRRFSGDERAIYLSVWEGWEISKILPQVDKFFRQSQAVWQQEWLKNEEYADVRKGWEDALERYRTFLSDLGEKVEKLMPKPGTKGTPSAAEVFEIKEVDMASMDDDQKTEYRREKRKAKRMAKKALIKSKEASGAVKRIFILSTNQGLDFVQDVIKTENMFSIVHMAVRRGYMDFETYTELMNLFKEQRDYLAEYMGEITAAINTANMRKMMQESGQDF